MPIIVEDIALYDWHSNICDPLVSLLNYFLRRKLIIFFNFNMQRKQDLMSIIKNKLNRYIITRILKKEINWYTLGTNVDVCEKHGNSLPRKLVEN
jgi:putative NIF3 family GTP cyclohydrolase 1 type 2